MELVPLSWMEIVGPDNAVLELICRGTVIYFVVLVFMRLMPRLGGELAVMDLVFLLLVADAASQALGEYTSIFDAVLVIGTLMAWNYALNVLSFRFPLVEKLISGSPLPVVRNGKLLARNLRREYVTKDELMAQLRSQGIETVEEVKVAYIESEGHLTVIPRKK